MTTKVRLGVIGAGWPGQQHARAVRASSGAILQAVAEPNEERRAEFCREYAPESCHPDYAGLLGDKKVDAAVICLPNHLHFPVSLAALRAGKHVFCEKPPTLNGAEMRVLQEEARRLGLVYFFGRQFRFTPAMRLARDLIARGELGSIYFAEALWVRSRGIPAGLEGWFTDKKRSGGGALIDLGVHALDSAWFLIGTPRPVSVTAAVFQNFPQLVRGGINDVEDAAFAFIRFKNDAVVQLKTSWAGNLTDDIPQGLVFGRESNNCTVYGTRATVRLKPLTLFRDREGQLIDEPLEPSEATADSFILQMQNFVDAITGRATPVNDAQQAVYLMEMLDAIYLSSATGREAPIAQA